jgi:conjugative transfer signal peptidase TraF
MATSGLWGRLRNTSPRTAKLIGATALSTCVGTFLLMGMLGVRINASPSLPLGLYVETSDQSGLVEFCPAEPLGSFAAARGYRSKGSCPDGASPLMKPVIARAEDLVEISSLGIAVNGVLVRNTAPRRLDTSGRAMTPWPFGLTASLPAPCGWRHHITPKASIAVTSVRLQFPQFAPICVHFSSNHEAPVSTRATRVRTRFCGSGFTADDRQPGRDSDHRLHPRTLDSPADQARSIYWGLLLLRRRPLASHPSRQRLPCRRPPRSRHVALRLSRGDPLGG